MFAGLTQNVTYLITEPLFSRMFLKETYLYIRARSHVGILESKVGNLQCIWFFPYLSADLPYSQITFFWIMNE